MYVPLLSHSIHPSNHLSIHHTLPTRTRAPKHTYTLTYASVLNKRGGQESIIQFSLSLAEHWAYSCCFLIFFLLSADNWKAELIFIFSLHYLTQTHANTCVYVFTKFLFHLCDVESIHYCCSCVIFIKFNFSIFFSHKTFVCIFFFQHFPCAFHVSFIHSILICMIWATLYTHF